MMIQSAKEKQKSASATLIGTSACIAIGNTSQNIWDNDTTYRSPDEIESDSIFCVILE